MSELLPLLSPHTIHGGWPAWPEQSSALSGTLRCPPFSLGVEVKDRDFGRRRRAPANEPRPIYSRYRRRGNAGYIMEPRAAWRAPDQCGIELSRLVVALDPPRMSGEEADEPGVVCGREG